MLPDPGALYRDHAASVWRYARARLPTDADAEDVTSDVFSRALRSARTFDAGVGSQGAWIMGIARHATADWWRRRTPEAPMAELPDTAQGDGPDVVVVARAAAADDVRRLLDLLSEREREVVALRFASELSSAQIGDALGISPTAARMLLHRAVTKLRGVVDHG